MNQYHHFNHHSTFLALKSIFDNFIYKLVKSNKISIDTTACTVINQGIACDSDGILKCSKNDFFFNSNNDLHIIVTF